MGQRAEKGVLFLCTGNYYRSRFAEVLFNALAREHGLPWRAESRGLALERGVNNVGPMAASAVKALEAMGVRAGDAITRMPAPWAGPTSRPAQKSHGGGRAGLHSYVHSWSLSSSLAVRLAPRRSNKLWLMPT